MKSNHHVFFTDSKNFRCISVYIFPLWGKSKGRKVQIKPNTGEKCVSQLQQSAFADKLTTTDEPVCSRPFSRLHFALSDGARTTKCTTNAPMKAISLDKLLPVQSLIKYEKR